MAVLDPWRRDLLMLLNEEEITGSLAGIVGWQREGACIVRHFKFDGFMSALAFVNQVGAVAEAADHHPDIRLFDWNHVELKLTTHSSSGLTRKDFDLAGRIDALAPELSNQ